MRREEAKELLPMIQAFAEGKTIEVLNSKEEWIESDNPYFDLPCNLYRIKKELKYRPFKSQEECWSEMHKHPDFGWIVAKKSKIMYNINIVGDGYMYIDNSSIIFCLAFGKYEFIDGTPFGIMEE